MRDAAQRAPCASALMNERARNQHVAMSGAMSRHDAARCARDAMMPFTMFILR